MFEEVKEVDLILYLIDFLNEDYVGYEKMVFWLFEEFEVDDILMLMVYNKCD